MTAGLAPRPGVYRPTLTFSHPVLAGWEWPTIEIVGERQGPRIAIWAGMHVNEVSSIEAAYRLADVLEPGSLAGRVSIMPVLNLPALAQRTKLTCPVDGKNINFCFPGAPEGTFSEVLAHVLLNEWADDAVCTFDLHGGDVNEDVDHYIMIQLTGDGAFDSRLRETADAFGAATRVEFAPVQDGAYGRSITGRSHQHKLAIMTEAGNNARLAAEDVDFHLRGVLSVAARLGMIDAPSFDLAPPAAPSFMPCDVRVVRSAVRGWGTHLSRPGVMVAAGDPLVEVHDYESGKRALIVSPFEGQVIWTDHHPAVEVGQAIGGIATEE